jgi:hypothetical protein
MRCFLCSLDGMRVGIPAERAERIVLQDRAQAAVYAAGTGDGGSCISLPVLLRQKDVPAPHGVVLKSDSPGTTILLTPKIDGDMEIPEESIHPLPEALSGLRRYFEGASFAGKNMILILSPEKIRETLEGPCGD